jgi:hypothetical protein
LKQPPGVARAKVVATELLDELDLAVHEALAALHVGFGWVGPAALRGYLESGADR